METDQADRDEKIKMLEEYITGVLGAELPKFTPGKLKQNES
jgi:hypothetical protein